MVMIKKYNIMKSVVVEGGVTAPSGFLAWGAAAGIKISGQPDVGIIASKTPCTACGTFTTNKARAACVDYNSSLLPSGSIRAICCNSGNANACTGNRGEKDVRATAAEVALHIKCRPAEVLAASTGVIGHFLPMDKLKTGIKACCSSLSCSGGGSFTRAIMTTDLVPKEYAVKVRLSGGDVVIGGCAKGSGMICPNMATMLCFITTDAKLSHSSFNTMLKKTVNETFNNLTVDGDMSTNDMVLALANGSSGVNIKTSADMELFGKALFEVCNSLCAKIAADGEGATKRVEIRVTGGKTFKDCKKAAGAVANSNLVKTAIFGNDPNWGRILCAVGYSGASFEKSRIVVKLCNTKVFAGMRPCKFDAAKLSGKMRSKLVSIDIDLGEGSNCAIAQTCDLTYDYIKINADYHT
jgi:glutamate N-acetyltransferase/amino-acid N-acetyltransferase